MAKAIKQTGSDSGNYQCLITVRHNGTAYPPGSFIDLSEDQAESLVASKAVKLKDSKANEE